MSATGNAKGNNLFRLPSWLAKTRFHFLPQNHIEVYGCDSGPMASRQLPSPKNAIVAHPCAQLTLPCFQRWLGSNSKAPFREQLLHMHVCHIRG